MTERPILFSGGMVRALLDGRKTQTRRVVKGSESFDALLASEQHRGEFTPWRDGEPQPSIFCPYGAPGDRLWVREGGELLRHAYDHDPGSGQDLWADAGWVHFADGAVVAREVTDPPLSEWILDCSRRSRPSIHMPRWACRLVLEVTEVCVERLQDISEADARAEGYDPIAELGGTAPHAWYALLWDAINGGGAWDANPWVWAVSFEAVRP